MIKNGQKVPFFLTCERVVVPFWVELHPILRLAVGDAIHDHPCEGVESRPPRNAIPGLRAVDVVRSGPVSVKKQSVVGQLVQSLS